MKFVHVLYSLLLLFLLGCSPEKEHVYTPIKISYPHWAEGEALTYLAENYLEEMGFDVVLKCQSIENIYYSINNGSQDVFLDAWLPDTQRDYYSKYKDNIEILSTVIDHARIGLVVPSYVPINSIEELRNTSGMFDGRILGVEQGAGIMRLTKKAIKTYGLSNYKLCTSSEKNTMTVLSYSVKKEIPVVITGWDFHWKFLRYDLKFLDDPKGIYSKNDKIKIVTRKNFSKEKPKAAEALKQFHISKDQFMDLLNTYRLMNTETEKKAAIKNWMHEHRNQIMISEKAQS